MLTYTVKVSTGNLSLGPEGSIDAATVNSVSIKLVGREGESERTQLNSTPEEATDFSQLRQKSTGSQTWSTQIFVNNVCPQTSTFSVDCPVSLGELVLIELKKDALPERDDWFPTKIDVKSPEGVVYRFPIYQWVDDGQPHLFREGKALTSSKDELPLAKKFREEELEQRKKEYQWDVYEEGIPQCMKADNPQDLPLEVQFSFTKSKQFAYTLQTSLEELKLKLKAENSKDTWENIESIASVRNTELADYVQEHWTEDAFFGYQYLNGVNPILIRRCTALPDNFPVLSVLSSEHGQNLEDDMKNGNIFLLDYKNLDGVEANVIAGEQQYLMAPLVLLHSTPDRKLMPVAIQLKQEPSEDNPIFLPTDPLYDWLLAKIYVRSADFSEQELNVHLLRTHLLAEVFAVSLLRNVPMVHPLYKLLIPHTRYTLQINNMARNLLISPSGFFQMNASSGGEAMKTILQRSTALLTYSSLCPPDDIKERGMDSVPGYYYRDDALRLWAVIHSFVKGILGYYYEKDVEVQRDTELQMWIWDIFEHGFLSNASTGIPQSLSSVDELVKFVTMVIFTCSAQHNAVNAGQFDYGGWMPNNPSTLRRPPSATKGSSGSVLQTLPDTGNTAYTMAVLWLLSNESTDFVALGHHPEEYFTEVTPRKLMIKFRAELAMFSVDVSARNQSLEVPYTYMDPDMISNSVAI